jgi:15-cis-phytoene synthase
MSQALALSRASIALHSKSFALASRLLPSDGRDEAAVVYAWCRRADDAVDLVPSSEQAGAVARLRRELAAIYDGDAQIDPILAAFQSVVESRRIPRAYPAELLSGMAMDAEGAMYRTYAGLLSYCFRVAGTVGLMMSHVMGVRHPTALRHAAHLGMAMQLTNICRDVQEDWQRGRLYLPDEWLTFAGRLDLRARLGDPMPKQSTRAVASVIRELLRRADAFYASGEQGIPLLSFRSALSVRTASFVYADIGRAILAQNADPFAPRAVVGTARKLRLMLRALKMTIGQVPRRFDRALLEGALGFHDVVSI